MVNAGKYVRHVSYGCCMYKFGYFQVLVRTIWESAILFGFWAPIHTMSGVVTTMHRPPQQLHTTNTTVCRQDNTFDSIKASKCDLLMMMIIIIIMLACTVLHCKTHFLRLNLETPNATHA